MLALETQGCCVGDTGCEAYSCGPGSSVVYLWLQEMSTAPAPASGAFQSKSIYDQPLGPSADLELDRSRLRFFTATYGLGQTHCVIPETISSNVGGNAYFMIIFLSLMNNLKESAWHLDVVNKCFLLLSPLPCPLNPPASLWTRSSICIISLTIHLSLQG